MVEPITLSDRELAAHIEHTCLKPDATFDQIVQLCEEAKRYHFSAVCVNPIMVPLAVETLSDSGIPVVAVANFPLGQSSWESVNEEVAESCALGASQIDLVLPLQTFQSTEINLLDDRIRAVREIMGSDRTLKCIVELSLLGNAYWALAFECVRSSRANMFKTGTGFFGGVSIEMVSFLRNLDPGFPIKASGGIVTRNQAIELLAAGVSKLGTSRSVEILTKSS